MNTEEKIRWLAEQAGWEPDDCDCDYPECSWNGFFIRGKAVERIDYPNSLDAIARDLLPILREKGWRYGGPSWNGEQHRFIIWDPVNDTVSRGTAETPARAAFEAIFEALHGGTE